MKPPGAAALVLNGLPEHVELRTRASTVSAKEFLIGLTIGFERSTIHRRAGRDFMLMRAMKRLLIWWMLKKTVLKVK